MWKIEVLKFNRKKITRKKIKMQSLFSNKEEKKEDKNSVKLNITLLMEEFADYVNSIKNKGVSI